MDEVWDMSWYLVLPILLIVSGCVAKPEPEEDFGIDITEIAIEDSPKFIFKDYELGDFEISVSSCYNMQINLHSVTPEELELIERLKEYGPRQKRAIRDFVEFYGLVINGDQSVYFCKDEVVLQINVDGKTVLEIQ